MGKLKIVYYSEYRAKGVRARRNKESQLYKRIAELEEGEGIKLVNFAQAPELRGLAARVNQHLENPFEQPFKTFRQIIDDNNLTYLIRRQT